MADEEPKTGGTFYFHYFDKIDMQRVQFLMAITSEVLVKRKPDSLYFMLSTPGGEVAAGITLHNFLRSLPCEIVMHNIGSVDSIGAIIFLAGETRYASVGTSFMFHGVTVTTIKAATFKLPALKETLSAVKADEDKIARLISSRCGLTDAEMRVLFLSGEAKDVDFALSKGLIQDVREAVIPRDADFHTFRFAGND